jgi:hypothetical protein
VLLRHGLSPSTSLSALASAFSLTHNAAAAAVPFTLSRPSAATLLLHAPLLPSTTYTLRAAADPAVRDGFNLPLLPSQSTFTTAAVKSKLLLPGETDRNWYSYAGVGPLRFAVAPAKAAKGKALLSPDAWPGVAHGSGGVCRRQKSRTPHCQPNLTLNMRLSPVFFHRYGRVMATLASRD